MPTHQAFPLLSFPWADISEFVVACGKTSTCKRYEAQLGPKNTPLAFCWYLGTIGRLKAIKGRTSVDPESTPTFHKKHTKHKARLLRESKELEEGINITNGSLLLNQLYCNIQTDIREDLLVQVVEELASEQADDDEDDTIAIQDNTTNPTVHSSITAKQGKTAIHLPQPGHTGLSSVYQESNTLRASLQAMQSE